jgi:hypothetical protein
MRLQIVIRSEIKSEERNLMENKRAIIPLERVENTIFQIRGCNIILDRDLAVLYGTTTRALNQAVKRNLDRFPPDFMFQLSDKEKHEVITICDRLSRLKFATNPPFAFTEHGAIMAASVLNTKRAIEVSVFVVRAFVKMREMLSTHKEVAHKLAELERRLEGHDEAIKTLVAAIRELMQPPQPKKLKIGFKPSK